MGTVIFINTHGTVEKDRGLALLVLGSISKGDNFFLISIITTK